MNVLFVFGNGFDKAQGLATSYQEFYTDYQKLAPSSDLEAQLKRDIQDNYETWADLEEALGKYSAKFTDVDSFREVLRILNSRLRNYLKKQSSSIDTLGLSKQKLVKGIMYPEDWLEPKQKTDYSNFRTHFRTSDIHCDCVTLNYTDTFEVVFDNHESFLGHLHQTNSPVYFKEIIHLHGTLDDMILVGVNDVSQIANEAFRSSEELREEFVKPEINAGCENMKNETFLDLIQTAHVVVLMGVSVGITDSQWWQAIGKRLETSPTPFRLIYYPFDPEKDTTTYPSRKLRWSKEYIAFLKERMGIGLSVDDLRDIIYVGINKPYLKLN